MSTTYISDIETGRKKDPRLSTVEKIEKAMGLKRGQLVNPPEETCRHA